MSKIKLEHLKRKAFLYIRQSTLRQVHENTESTRRQYALKERLLSAGWDESAIEIIDSELGQSGAESEGRHGFLHLVSEVSLGRAGIVAGIEVSRLSRSSSDWNKLLQIAALSNTLIMDEDGVYNVNDFNDRLLLGLKGTLSEAELHYLKARMRGGALNKAKRGELKRRLAIGYVYNEDNRITKDPDVQVQEAITVFFNTFKRLGSAHGVVREYEKQGILFPCRPHQGLKLGELSWKRLTTTRAVWILKNPIYAGVYVFGKIAKNTHPNSKHSGAVREGSALLQGIVLCGICGRKMNVRYGTIDRSRQQPAYICHFDYSRYGSPMCQRIPGGNIDDTIKDLLLETINPLTVDATISIQREMAQRKEEIVRFYEQKMERTRYEMELAKRRYLRVDPDNRLVAAELERDWNQKSVEYEAAKMDYEQKYEAEILVVNDKLKAELENLVVNFPKIWNDPQVSHKEKKRIARTLLEDVTITSDPSKVILGVRFKGGATRTIELPNTRRNLAVFQNEQNVVAEIKRLIPQGLTNPEIADTLNEMGFRNGKDNMLFNHWTIGNIITRHNLPKRFDVAKAGGWLTTKEKMEELNVSKTQLRRMRRAGKVEFKESKLFGQAFLYKPENNSNV